MATLERCMAGVPEAEIETMVFTNTVNLYNIDVAKLP